MWDLFGLRYMLLARFFASNAPVMMATASDMLHSFGLTTATLLAKPLDVDAVGQFEHLRHVVADQDNR